MKISGQILIREHSPTEGLIASVRSFALSYITATQKSNRYIL